MNTRLRTGLHGLVLAVLCLHMCQICPLTAAAADELEEFEHARKAYEQARYERAIKRFEALVGGEEPRLRSPPLTLESRKYLAASYLFAGEPERAEEQFERLLRQDPDYELDPVVFPREVHEVFASVRERLSEERQREEETRREQLGAERERRRELDRQRRRIEQLEEIARTEVVREENSRWIATIPFGVGQFQNGHRRLGLTLAIAEGVMAATSITTFLLHRSVLATDLGPPPDGCSREDADFCTRLGQREKAYRYTNWASSGLFVGLALVGILDAHLRFVPHTERTRRREVPPEVQIGAGPTSLHLKIAF